MSEKKLIKNIHFLMENNGLSLRELAENTKITHAGLHKILKGQTTTPKPSTLKCLADYFNRSVQELTKEDLTSKPHIPLKSVKETTDNWDADLLKDSINIITKVITKSGNACSQSQITKCINSIHSFSEVQKEHGKKLKIDEALIEWLLFHDE